MQIQNIQITKIKPYHLNCKIHNKENIQAIKLSLKKFNQYKPLIVSKKTNEIIIGNGTFQALSELNYKTVSIIYLELTEQQQKILNISDNKISELSTWTEQLINKISEFDKNLIEALNFDQNFLKKLKKNETNFEKKLDILKNDVIFNDDDTKLLVNKEIYVKCPCCGREFKKP